MIPTSFFPQTEFIEKIKKKSNLTEIEIFQDFASWQNRMQNACCFLSELFFRGIFFTPCATLTEIAVNNTLGILKSHR